MNNTRVIHSTVHHDGWFSIRTYLIHNWYAGHIHPLHTWNLRHICQRNVSRGCTGACQLWTVFVCTGVEMGTNVRCNHSSFSSSLSQSFVLMVRVSHILFDSLCVWIKREESCCIAKWRENQAWLAPGRFLTRLRVPRAATGSIAQGPKNFICRSSTFFVSGTCIVDNSATL